MSRYTITPWRTQRDLLQVRQQIYRLDKGETDSRRSAVDRIMAWKLRGNLPHAVESTALLVDAILHHNIRTNSTFSIRAVYSAAFTRFVTGFCDIGRHKERSLEPSSMLEIAKQIDMPDEFVALRHEATHEELPGIQRLVTATQQALDWLWRVYWSRLEESETVEDTKSALPMMKKEASALLRHFRKARVDALRRSAQEPPGQAQEVLAARDACVEICKHEQLRIDAFAGVLVEERLIVPSNRELGSSLQGAYLIWDELLRSVAGSLNGFLPTFVRALLQNLTASNAQIPERDAERESLAMWLLHIVDSDQGLGGWRAESRSLHVDILRWCCLHPGYWTEHVGREILRQGNESLQEEWKDLFEASLLKAAGDRGDDIALERNSQAQRDGPVDMDREMQVNERGAELVGGGWRRAMVPASLPIGVI